MASYSTWDIENNKEYPKLESNIEADVAVVGGGLAGVWCAYLLSKAGQRVVLLEMDKIGAGASRYTTAFITQAVDTQLIALKEMFDLPTARAVWSSGREAIDLIQNTVESEGIECDFMHVPLHIYARNRREYHKLVEEHLLAEKLGFDTNLKKDAKLAFAHMGVLEIEDQAKYHPIKFLNGLAEAASRQGVEIYEKTAVEEVVGNAPAKVLTAGGHIVTARSVVIATYDPLGNPRPTRFKKGMYMSYCLELSMLHGEVPEGLYVDTHNPYHYIRVDNLEGGVSRMIVGGEDHRSELNVPEEKNFKALKEYVDKTFPNLRAKETKRWKGGILEPSDGLALIGETAPKRYVATAFSGNGMTYAAIAGQVITDLITNKYNPYTEIYDPKRKMQVKAVLYKARDYTSEFFGAAAKNIFK